MKRNSNKDAVFQTISAAARMTGLSQAYLRRRVRAGDIPALRVGEGSNAVYLLDTEALLEQLRAEARS